MNVNTNTDPQIIKRGFDWARTNGIDVISCSWGGHPPSTMITQSISDALNNGRIYNGVSKGCVVVFSTRNTNEDVYYPANALPDIQVSLKPNAIETIYPNPTSDEVIIVYKINQGDSAYLSLTGFYGSNISNNYILDITENEVTLNLNTYSSGLYAVALIVNGQFQDSKTIIKQ